MQSRPTVAVVAAALLLGCSGNPAPAASPGPAQAASGPRTIFYDTFDNVKPEWQQVSGTWEIRAGELVQRSDDPRQLNAIRFITTPRISDATIETFVQIAPVLPATITANDSELLEGVRYKIGAGIVFRMTDPRNFYMFRLAGEEGAVLGRMQDGEWNERDLCNPRVRDFLSGERIGFRRDNWYRLKVEAYGNRLVVSINDEPVCSVNDDSFGIGQVGLVTFKTAAAFDHIKIYNKFEQ